MTAGGPPPTRESTRKKLRRPPTARTVGYFGALGQSADARRTSARRAKRNGRAYAAGAHVCQQRGVGDRARQRPNMQPRMKPQ